MRGRLSFVRAPPPQWHKRNKMRWIRHADETEHPLQREQMTTVYVPTHLHMRKGFRYLYVSIVPPPDLKFIPAMWRKCDQNLIRARNYLYCIAQYKSKRH